MTTARAIEALAARAARPGWTCLLSGTVAHHYPVHDIFPHTPTGCGCGTRRERGAEATLDSGLVVPITVVVWHSAWDGRDLVAMCEEGTLLPPNGGSRV